MPYKVPASKASLKQNIFEFEMPGSAKKYKLPKLRFIKPSLIEKLDGANKSTIAGELIRAYIPDLYEMFDDAEQLVEFYEAWAEASGISMGESKASAGSSKSTGAPSTETSSK